MDGGNDSYEMDPIVEDETDRKVETVRFDPHSCRAAWLAAVQLRG